MAALSKACGKGAVAIMLSDWENCLVGSRTEFCERRCDLSRKAPEATSYAKFIGESRVLCTAAVHVRPGDVADFEALLKDAKAAGEQAAATGPAPILSSDGRRQRYDVLSFHVALVHETLRSRAARVRFACCLHDYECSSRT
jgi:hypothetical protein